METRKKLILGGAVALALGAVGTGVGIAANGDDEKPLRGTTEQRASEAALDHVGGGTVVETEAGDGGSAYEVEISKDDGTEVEVELDEGFNVTGSEQDDDGTNEKDDDANEKDDD